MKKNLILIFVSGLILLGSCVQRTCPTYTNTKEVKEIKKTEIKS